MVRARYKTAFVCCFEYIIFCSNRTMREVFKESPAFKSLKNYAALKRRTTPICTKEYNKDNNPWDMRDSVSLLLRTMYTAKAKGYRVKKAYDKKVNYCLKEFDALAKSYIKFKPS